MSNESNHQSNESQTNESQTNESQTNENDDLDNTIPEGRVADETLEGQAPAKEEPTPTEASASRQDAGDSATSSGTSLTDAPIVNEQSNTRG